MIFVVYLLKNTIHYRVFSARKTVSIKAVFCDFEDPDKWGERTE